MDITSLVPVAQLGSSGAIIVLSFLFWYRLKEKDERFDQLTDRVMQSFEAQTRVNSEVKDSIQNNTKAVETLTERLYDVIKTGGRATRK